MDSCPIRMDGETVGILRWRPDGGYTVFSGRCPLRPGLVRLRVFGPGGEGYLGVMEPAGGELRLERRLTRAQLSAFPQRIEYAAPGPEKPPEAPPPGRETETLWYAVGDGTLYTRTERGALRALPLIEGRLPPGCRERRLIEGVTYGILPIEERPTAGERSGRS